MWGQARGVTALTCSSLALMMTVGALSARAQAQPDPSGALPSLKELKEGVSALDHILKRSLELYPEARLVLWSDEGRFDLSEMTLTVTGVGTPLLLSPTGGLATEELGRLARRDAHRRLSRGLKRLRAQLSPPVTARELSPKPLSCRVTERLTEGLEAAQPQRFSDGSVHLRARLALRALSCPQPRERGGERLSVVRLKGSALHALTQLPTLIDDLGQPIPLQRVRYLREHPQARAVVIESLQARARSLSHHMSPGTFVVNGGSLANDEELWVFISEREERP